MGSEGSQIRVWFEILLISKVGSFTARKSQTNREGEGENMEAEEDAVIGFWSAFGWLDGMIVFIALLSEYVVDTIEVLRSDCGKGRGCLITFAIAVIGTKITFYYCLNLIQNSGGKKMYMYLYVHVPATMISLS
ncbi:unnamed protein product [Trifolium pratense]|uniref:Uncharacterized protein n=1 Tax=Trifolium pratense TaxID=57577 RepID=A0ACB0JHY6_TRIPR|nr:unnamed protein product [Trifolium pratense]